jgi:hypothetical protein
MALSVTNSIPIITPAYSPMEFVMSSPGCDYMELDVYIGDASKGQDEGTKRTIRIISTSVVADIQNIVQPFFSSDASAHVNLKRIDIKAHSITSGVDTSVWVDNFYVFNGVQNNGTFDPSMYIMNDSHTEAKFMNNMPRFNNIHWGDEDSKLYFFQGTFTNSTGTYDASTVGFDVYVDGSAALNYQFPNSTTPDIKVLNASPLALNSLISGLVISSSNLKYKIVPENNTVDTYSKTFYIKPIDERYVPKRVAYIDSMGCIDYFNFDLAKVNTVNITKNIFNNNGTFKTYNNKISDSYTITSNWITDEESEALKDLWYSPSVMVDGKYAITSNRNVQILKRKEVKLVNYTVDYELANEFKTQIF